MGCNTDPLPSNWAEVTRETDSSKANKSSPALRRWLFIKFEFLGFSEQSLGTYYLGFLRIKTVS